ncbi:MAG: Holliday junction resolvase RuvX [Coprobacillus sp.]|nr:Holliday junction resolvase RuvX [Coprobacillus sp.]
MEKYLGLDLGTQTLGLADSDDLGIVHPLKTLTFHHRQFIEIIDELYDICQEKRIKTLVIGLPLNMNDRSGEKVKYVHNFVMKVNQKYPDLKFEYEDERLTTIQAYEEVNEMKFKDKLERKLYVDQVSACIILETYLKGGNGYGK